MLSFLAMAGPGGLCSLLLNLGEKGRPLPRDSPLRQAVGPVPQEQQAPVRQGDLGRAAQKWLLTPRETGGGTAFSRGTAGPGGVTPAASAPDKTQRECLVPPGNRRSPRGQDGGQISAAHQIAVGVLVRQIVQELKIGYGMIQPWPIQRP